MNEIDLEKHRREEIRWRVLKVLDAGRPQPVPETLVLMTLQDVSLPVSPHSLRRELAYLEDRKLVRLGERDTPTWTADLTRYGVDVVEYSVDCLPGIARPRKWY